MSDQIAAALKYVSDWWWIILPFVLWKLFIKLYIWWRQEVFNSKLKMILLELKMPREVVRPYKAMEQVFAGWWALYDAPDWWEKWIDGKFLVSMSIEIVSEGGSIHFYLRIPQTTRNFIESSIFAQYPDVEITEAEDYTKHVPQDIPNEEWDLWGCDYQMLKPDVYPIKTYTEFFEQSESLLEEKRIDPMASLLEGMSKLKPGEYLWLQLKIKPLTNEENNYNDRAKDITSVLLKRTPAGPPQRKPIIKEAFDTIAFGYQEPQKFDKKEEIIPAEMRLSPGERDIVAAIENKVSKVMYECYFRFIFLGKKGAFYKPNLKNTIAFFNNFNTENLNSLKPFGRSITKVRKHERGFTNIFFYDSLLYLVKRKIWRQYLSRVYYYYPKAEKKFVLNTEELATIFHFVGRTNVPAPDIQRIESKKSEPPSNLPVM
jgi:hypothetical protein